jgi:hypothetical protein
VALFLPAGQRAGHVQPVGFVVDKVALARIFFPEYFGFYL